MYMCSLPLDSLEFSRLTASSSRAFQRAVMSTLSNQNFGLVIAYLLPGFVALWGMIDFSPTVASWITTSQHDAPTVPAWSSAAFVSLQVVERLLRRRPSGKIDTLSCPYARARE